ncbi:MAG: hypothetical protein JRJ77_14525 [Deltaproteobacteria bacterium]|nr:hypothetical protein [Deltaproteobacteria bacterium]
MEQLIKLLIDNLASKGMEVTSIPAYIRNFAHTLVAHPSLSLQELNSHLQMLGWDDFSLDNDTLYLILATFEPDLAFESINWFDHTFNSNTPPKLADKRERGPRLQRDKNTPSGE